MLLDRPTTYYQPTHAFLQSRDYTDTQSRIVRGKAFPLAGATVAGTPPSAGRSPQRPERQSADGIFVTG